jgi:hypothetical protein
MRRLSCRATDHALWRNRCCCADHADTAQKQGPPPAPIVPVVEPDPPPEPVTPTNDAQTLSNILEAVRPTPAECRWWATMPPHPSVGRTDVADRS